MAVRKDNRQATTRQYVVFRLGDVHVGVHILQVLRVLPRLPVTRVPRAPDFLMGVVNDHGEIVPVVDLKRRMELSDAESSHDDANLRVDTPGGNRQDRRIIVVEQQDQIVGMLVDAVVGLWHLEDDAIAPPPEMVAEVNGVYLSGVAHYEGKLIVLLDLERILTLEEEREMATWQQARDREGGDADDH